MLKAIGLDDADLACLRHRDDVDRDAQQLEPAGARAHGGAAFERPATPLEFNTIAVSDGVSMGTRGCAPRSSPAR